MYINHAHCMQGQYQSMLTANVCARDFIPPQPQSMGVVHTRHECRRRYIVITRDTHISSLNQLSYGVIHICAVDTRRRYPICMRLSMLTRGHISYLYARRYYIV